MKYNKGEMPKSPTTTTPVYMKSKERKTIEAGEANRKYFGAAVIVSYNGIDTLVL